jgi:hypothetical protein
LIQGHLTIGLVYHLFSVHHLCSGRENVKIADGSLSFVSS